MKSYYTWGGAPLEKVEIIIIMKKIIFFILIINTITIFSQDDRWIFFATSKSGLKGYYDKETVIINSNSVKVWVKYITKESEYDEVVGKYYHEYVHLTYIYCKDNKTQTIQEVRYYIDGSSDSFECDDTGNIPPGTMIELLQKLLCK